MKRIFVLLLVTFCLFVQAEPEKNVLTDCVIQEVLPGKHMTAAFFTLHHEGGNQSIVGAKIPSVTDTVMLHRMVHKNGAMEMEKIDSYPLQHDETLLFRGNYHLMLMKIKQAPEIGSKHHLTLVFNDGKTAVCQAIVKTVSEVQEDAKRQL